MSQNDEALLNGRSEKWRTLQWFLNKMMNIRRTVLRRLVFPAFQHESCKPDSLLTWMWVVRCLMFPQFVATTWYCFITTRMWRRRVKINKWFRNDWSWNERLFQSFMNDYISFVVGCFESYIFKYQLVALLKSWIIFAMNRHCNVLYRYDVELVEWIESNHLATAQFAVPNQSVMAPPSHCWQFEFDY